MLQFYFIGSPKVVAKNCPQTMICFKFLNMFQRPNGMYLTSSSKNYLSVSSASNSCIKLRRNVSGCTLVNLMNLMFESKKGVQKGDIQPLCKINHRQIFTYAQIWQIHGQKVTLFHTSNAKKLRK